LWTEDNRDDGLVGPGGLEPTLSDLAHDFDVADESMAFRLKIRQLAGYDAKHESAAQWHKAVDIR